MKPILPTVGRVLYFQPSSHDRVISRGEQPMRADIIYVHSDTEVKLHVIDHDGNHYTMANVPLVQEGNVTPSCGYAYWMPFQVGQAKAAEPAPAPAPPDALNPPVTAANPPAPPAPAPKKTAKR